MGVVTVNETRPCKHISKYTLKVAFAQKCRSEKYLEIDPDPDHPCPLSDNNTRKHLCKFYDPGINLDIPTAIEIMKIVNELRSYGDSELLIQGYNDGHTDALSRVEVAIKQLIVPESNH